MPEAKYDLREIARSALSEMPEHQRGPFLTALICELNGRDAVALLASARNAITLRMECLMDEMFPPEVQGDVRWIDGVPHFALPKRAAAYLEEECPESVRDDDSSADRFDTFIARIDAAEDGWAEAVKFIGECRQANQQAGGDDELFIHLVAAQVVLMDLPVVGGGRS